MSILKIGVIGYGARGKILFPSMQELGIPFEVTAVADLRSEELSKTEDPFLKKCEFFKDADEMLENCELDGVMISTNCVFHTPLACKVAKRNLPIFLEKPAAVSFEQLEQLAKAFSNYKPPVVVSFPLRVSPLVAKVKQLVDADEIGSVEHIAAVNDVPYGRVYYNSWYRDYEKVGGLFLQKATHDFDVLNYILEEDPVLICAMKSRRIYGGDHQHELRCRDCKEVITCPEGTFMLAYEANEHPRVDWERPDDWCVFSKNIRNEDTGNAIIEYKNGVQASYSQNFFARHKAARRGARLYGFKGTIEYDWYQQKIFVYNHRKPHVTCIDASIGEGNHFGGDRELCFDFLMAMKEAKPSRTPIRAGIVSASMCLSARESAETHKFCSIKVF